MCSKGQYQNRTKFSILLLVFFVVFSTDTLVIAQNVNTIPMRVCQAVTFLIIGYFLLKSVFRSSVIGKRLLIIMTVIICLLLSMILNNDFSGGYLIIIGNMLFAWFFCKYVSFPTFANAYIKVMIFIAYVSVICFVATPVLSQMSFLPNIINHSGVAYKNLLFTTIYSNGIMRNMGPFWEPGVFQLYLIIALILSLYFQASKKNYCILIIALVTTFSTTGYLALFMVFALYFFKKDTGKRNNKLLFAMFVLIMLSLFATSNLFEEVIINKFFSSTYSMSSGSRFMSFPINFMALRDGFFFGVGPKSLGKYISLYLNSINYTGYYGFVCNTNTILMIFAMFGVSVGVFFVECIIGGIRKIPSNIMVKLIILLIVVLELSSEPLPYSLMFMVMLMYGFMQNNTKNLS